MFWTTLLRLCSENHTTPNAVVKELGISVGSITAWKNGATPRPSTLQKLADYFRVSSDYLTAIQDISIDQTAEDISNLLEKLYNHLNELSVDELAKTSNLITTELQKRGKES